ncbi:MAG: RdgB/HAM1 family non-canonical purine NTP pyrophosphatase [Myxococcota bacterium]|nr:RdgB/HAM1 family non-canonical purine NTP pyrophosphatase [Myxococcota bacterium]
MMRSDGIPEIGRRLVVASGNRGKVREMVSLLANLPIEVCSLDGFSPVAFPQEGTDYDVNAIAKAQAVCDQVGEWAIADDSGLEVDALNGAPGPLSARYGGAGLDDSGRVAHLLMEVERSPESTRNARFVCHAAIATPDGRLETAAGFCPGTLLKAPSGEGGFGYDPVFVPTGYDRAMAELPAEVKDQISHRARALAQLIPVIESWSPSGLAPRGGGATALRRGEEG